MEKETRISILVKGDILEAKEIVRKMINALTVNQIIKLDEFKIEQTLMEITSVEGI